jgi:hypothetical protein
MNAMAIFNSQTVKLPKAMARVFRFSPGSTTFFWIGPWAEEPRWKARFPPGEIHESNGKSMAESFRESAFTKKKTILDIFIY